jgi:hypothetical protein
LTRTVCAWAGGASASMPPHATPQHITIAVQRDPATRFAPTDRDTTSSRTQCRVSVRREAQILSLQLLHKSAEQL